MAEPTNANAYNFESQLKLGEMLLQLGRLEEAAEELRKARDLNEIGAYTTPDDSPARADDLRRLALGLERVEQMRETTSRRNRRLAIGALIALFLLASFIFTMWMLNRAELIEIRATATVELESMAVRETEEASVLRFIFSEGTRQADQIVDLYAELGRSAAEGTRTASIVGVAPNIATAAAENFYAQGTLAAMVERLEREVLDVSNATPAPQQQGQQQQQQPAATSLPPSPVPTRLPDDQLGAVIESLRIDQRVANLRSGPGFEYLPKAGLLNGEVVKILAKSPDNYWYNVETEQGIQGWVHTSVAKPVALDWLPVASTIPAPPILIALPTDTPQPDEAADVGAVEEEQQTPVAASSEQPSEAEAATREPAPAPTIDATDVSVTRDVPELTSTPTPAASETPEP